MSALIWASYLAWQSLDGSTQAVMTGAKSRSLPPNVSVTSEVSSFSADRCCFSLGHLPSAR